MSTICGTCGWEDCRCPDQRADTGGQGKDPLTLAEARRIAAEVSAKAEAERIQLAHAPASPIRTDPSTDARRQDSPLRLLAAEFRRIADPSWEGIWHDACELLDRLVDRMDQPVPDQPAPPAPPARADRDDLRGRMRSVVTGLFGARRMTHICDAENLDPLTDALVAVIQPALDLAWGAWKTAQDVAESLAADLDQRDDRDDLRKRFARQLRSGGHVTPDEMAKLLDTIDQRDAEVQRLQQCWTDAADRANRAAAARDAADARHERLATALRKFADEHALGSHLIMVSEVYDLLAAHSAPEPDERAAVSRQWAEDWDSPEDSVYDAPDVSTAERAARKATKEDNDDR